jgi:hypothetical protein
MVRKFNYFWLILMYACVCFVFRCFRFETDPKPATSFGLFLLKQSVDSDDFSVKLGLEVNGAKDMHSFEIQSCDFRPGGGRGWTTVFRLSEVLNPQRNFLSENNTLTMNMIVSY